MSTNPRTDAEVPARSSSIPSTVLPSTLGSAKQVCVFSVDVEDWFHILDLPGTPPLTQWAALPSRVEKNFLRLLDILDEANAKVTCFFLAWVAQRFPHLVKEAAKRGHEVASHGYAHLLASHMTASGFCRDAKKSKSILEDVIGQPIYGYRAAGFSVTESTHWFFDKLIEAGYLYDSSVFPARRAHGGLRNGHRGPHVIAGRSGEIIEFPMTVEPVFGAPMCFFGGGYLRLFPYAMMKHMAKRVLANGLPVIFYVHPREIDPGQPRLPMNLKRRFKSYVNLGATEQKIRRILTDFDITSFQNLLSNGWQYSPAAALPAPQPPIANLAEEREPMQK
jgi:polysaccharide deacetylase family protein (PEP-CTERM system associated)